MKTILLLHDESGSPKPRFQNVAGSKVTQHASEGTPGCNCDRWGHPHPDRVTQIDAAFVFARTDCVNMHSGWLQQWLAGMRSSHSPARRQF